ncbi:unnamed protein product [Trichogramma brassicae]|uniref:Uncharacterized protein n=1 Tax=Trichogramma brassicae TaxID=86971 RepID=A0A6H5IJF8_9HYME|nr:unnamed protein product [Trichogramma brassicae]
MNDKLIGSLLRGLLPQLLLQLGTRARPVHCPFSRRYTSSNLFNAITSSGNSTAANSSERRNRRRLNRAASRRSRAARLALHRRIGHQLVHTAVRLGVHRWIHVSAEVKYTRPPRPRAREKQLNIPVDSGLIICASRTVHRCRNPCRRRRRRRSSSSNISRCCRTLQSLRMTGKLARLFFQSTCATANITILELQFASLFFSLSREILKDILKQRVRQNPTSAWRERENKRGRERKEGYRAISFGHFIPVFWIDSRKMGDWLKLCQIVVVARYYLIYARPTTKRLGITRRSNSSSSSSSSSISARQQQLSHWFCAMCNDHSSERGVCIHRTHYPHPRITHTTGAITAHSSNNVSRILLIRVCVCVCVCGAQLYVAGSLLRHIIIYYAVIFVSTIIIMMMMITSRAESASKRRFNAMNALDRGWVARARVRFSAVARRALIIRIMYQSANMEKSITRRRGVYTSARELGGTQPHDHHTLSIGSGNSSSSSSQTHVGYPKEEVYTRCNVQQRREGSRGSCLCYCLLRSYCRCCCCCCCCCGVLLSCAQPPEGASSSAGSDAYRDLSPRSLARRPYAFAYYTSAAPTGNCGVIYIHFYYYYAFAPLSYRIDKSLAARDVRCSGFTESSDKHHREQRRFDDAEKKVHGLIGCGRRGEKWRSAKIRLWQKQKKNDDDDEDAEAHASGPAAAQQLAGRRPSQGAGATLEQLSRRQLRQQRGGPAAAARHAAAQIQQRRRLSVPAAAGRPAAAASGGLSGHVHVSGGLHGLEGDTEAAASRAGAEERERRQVASAEGAATAASGLSEEAIFRLLSLAIVYKSFCVCTGARCTSGSSIIYILVNIYHSYTYCIVYLQSLQRGNSLVPAPYIPVHTRFAYWTFALRAINLTHTNGKMRVVVYEFASSSTSAQYIRCI